MTLNHDRLIQIRSIEKQIAKDRRDQYKEKSKKVWEEAFNIAKQKWQEDRDKELEHYSGIYNELLKAVGEAERRAIKVSQTQYLKSSELRKRIKNDYLLQQQRFKQEMVKAIHDKEALKKPLMEAKKRKQGSKNYGEYVRENHPPSTITPAIFVEDHISQYSALQAELYSKKINAGKAIQYDNTFFHNCGSVVAHRSRTPQPSAIQLAAIEKKRREESLKKKQQTEIRAEKKKIERYDQAIELERAEREKHEILEALESLSLQDRLRKQGKATSLGGYADDARARQRLLEPFQKNLEREFEKTFIETVAPTLPIHSEEKGALTKESETLSPQKQPIPDSSPQKQPILQTPKIPLDSSSISSISSVASELLKSQTSSIVIEPHIPIGNISPRNPSPNPSLDITIPSFDSFSAESKDGIGLSSVSFSDLSFSDDEDKKAFEILVNKIKK